MNPSDVVKHGERTWERHPDGQGGFRPIDPAHRGAFNLPCPHCNAPLARDASEAIIRRTVFGCEQCHKPSVGLDVNITPAQPRP